MGLQGNAQVYFASQHISTDQPLVIVPGVHVLCAGAVEPVSSAVPPRAMLQNVTLRKEALSTASNRKLPMIVVLFSLWMLAMVTWMTGVVAVASAGGAVNVPVGADAGALAGV